MRKRPSRHEYRRTTGVPPLRGAPAVGRHGPTRQTCLKVLQNRNDGSVVEDSERRHDALHLDRLEWVERDESRAALERARGPPPVISALCPTLNRDTLQEFLSGQNQISSPNVVYGPDGTFRGQNRQAARTAQLSLPFEF